MSQSILAEVEISHCLTFILFYFGFPYSLYCMEFVIHVEHNL